jgi:LysR family transcriptional regulator, nitrogen assimilation regulatory protein
MDIRQLKYFARIVELENMTAAAQSLFVAQPSLSQHVANLETELGTKLLSRGVQGTRPTPAGEKLYRYAKAILRQVEEAATALKLEQDVPTGRVSVGLHASTMQMIGFELVRRSQRDYPHIALEILESTNAALVDLINRQQLDIAVAADIRASANIDTTPVVIEELLLVGPADATLPAPAQLSDLQGLALILPSFPNSVRMKVENACIQHNLQYTVVTETAVATLMTTLVREGMGWSILPWATTLTGGTGIRYIEFEGQPLTRTLSLCTSRSAAATPACQAIRQLIETLMCEKVADGSWRHTAMHPDHGLIPTGSRCPG